MATQVAVNGSGVVQVNVATTPNIQVNTGRVVIANISNVPSANFANFANVANLANNVVGYVKVPFQYNTVSPKNIAVIPAGAVVSEVNIVINQAFSDPSATLTVGTVANPTQLVGAGDNKPNQIGTYATLPGQLYVSDTHVVLTINSGSSTSGNGMLIINY